MSDSPAPNLGELLGPLLAAVAEEARPGLLARLERGAGERYREWAESEVEQAAALRACADREDQIADSATRLFPLDSAHLADVEAAMTRAREVYMGAFEGLPIVTQWRMQASAERQGAGVWRLLASQQKDQGVRDALEICAGLEEESAAVLDELIAARS